MFSAQSQSLNREDKNIKPINLGSDIASPTQPTSNNRSNLDINIHPFQLNSDQHNPSHDWIDKHPSIPLNNTLENLNPFDCSTSYLPTSYAPSSSIPANVPNLSVENPSSSIFRNHLEFPGTETKLHRRPRGRLTYVMGRIRKLERLCEVDDTILHEISQKAYEKAIEDYCRKRGFVLAYAGTRNRNKARATGSGVRRKVQGETCTKLRKLLKKECKALFPLIRDLIQNPDFPYPYGSEQCGDAANNEQMGIKESSGSVTNKIPNVEALQSPTFSYTLMNANGDVIVEETVTNSNSGGPFAFEFFTASQEQENGTSSTMQTETVDNSTAESAPRELASGVSYPEKSLNGMLPPSLSHANMRTVVFNEPLRHEQEMPTANLPPSMSNSELEEWSLSASPLLGTQAIGPTFRSHQPQSFDRDFEDKYSL